MKKLIDTKNDIELMEVIQTQDMEYSFSSLEDEIIESIEDSLRGTIQDLIDDAIRSAKCDMITVETIDSDDLSDAPELELFDSEHLLMDLELVSDGLALMNLGDCKALIEGIVKSVKSGRYFI